MTDLLSQIIGGAFLLAGSFFLLVGAVGLVRMPDVFTRMHAASVGETLGGSLLLISMMFHSGFSLVTFKLWVLLMVIFLLGPVATHALARAARYAGIEPMLADAPAGQLGSTRGAEAVAEDVQKPKPKPAKTRRGPAKKKTRK